MNYLLIFEIIDVDEGASLLVNETMHFIYFIINDNAKRGR